MSHPVALYCAIHDSETKITIPVFEIPGFGFHAVMIPVARRDAEMMKHFVDPKLPSELDSTAEAAIGKCRSWIEGHISAQYEVLKENPSA